MAASFNMTPGTWGMMRHPKTIVHFHPIKSATDPEIKEPKKVPAERIEVIRDFGHVTYIYPLKAVG